MSKPEATRNVPQESAHPASPVGPDGRDDDIARPASNGVDAAAAEAYDTMRPSHDNAAGRPAKPRRPKEVGGRDGPDPTRYGDWEKAGRCIDF